MICLPARDVVNWSRPAHALPLSQNELHIWLAWLDVEQQERARLCSHLSEDEIARADRFVFSHDRDHFIVARGRLRELLGKYLECAPNAVEFKIGPYGKPSLLNHRGELCFNLSHSHGLALYGFCIGRELGIDTEKIRSGFAGEGIAERYFSVTEQRDLAEVPKELRDTAFFLCWTRKEAYIKAHGGGLQIALDSFDVSVKQNEPETLRSVDSSRWSLRSFVPAPEFVAAVIIEGEIQSTRFWSADRDPVSQPFGGTGKK